MHRCVEANVNRVHDGRLVSLTNTYGGCNHTGCNNGYMLYAMNIFSLLVQQIQTLHVGSHLSNRIKASLIPIPVINPRHSPMNASPKAL